MNFSLLEFLNNNKKNLNILFGGLFFSLGIAFLAEFFFRERFLFPIAFSNFDLQRLVFLALIIFSICFFIAISPRRKGFQKKDFFTIFIILIFSIVIIKTIYYFQEVLLLEMYKYEFFRVLSLSSFYMALPVASGAILLQAVSNSKVSLVFTLLWSIIIGIYFKEELPLVSFTAISSFVCIALSGKFRTRETYIKMGFNVFLLSLPITFAQIFLDSSISFSYIDLALRLFSGIVGAVLCYLIASGLTPILELLGGYVTDMRLNEIATLDHPLLKELSIQAPGTWNHSMVMGMMGEVASREVGANPVLMRTGAYFHDIGKIKKTMYFIENQVGITNPHDKLTPSMSALIIKSHIKEGVELAGQYKIPKPIVDMIQQHHGTTLIEFFYNKALKEQKEGEEAVNEELYRYSGPKPQSKEAGILMLADCIEASVRALPEHSVDKIQMLVQKMINKIFSLGELNECDLTLKDLNLISKSFVKTLIAIYHQRIAYDDPKSNKEETKLSK